MVQSSVLGGLIYRDSEHGWALEVGYHLLECEALQKSRFYATKQPAEVDERAHQSRNCINSILESHGVKYVFPVITGESLISVDRVAPALYEHLRRDATPSHIAFCLVGMAVYWLDLSRLPTMASVELPKSFARALLETISVQCSEIELDATALLDHFVRNGITQASMRRLLQKISITSDLAE